MRELNGNIRRSILETSEKLFQKKGFSGVSMRDISKESGVGLSNIYNYFRGKDEIFRNILAPAVEALENMLMRHHGEDGMSMLMLTDDQYCARTVTEYMTLIRRHRKTLKLLFFKAEESSLSNYRSEFTDHSTVVVKEWMRRQREANPQLRLDFSEMFIHLQSVWLFDIFEEVLSHDLSERETERVIQEYLRFEIEGWSKMMTGA